MSKRKLPQYPRFIPARIFEYVITLLLLAGISALLTYNISQRYIYPIPYWNERLAALTDPMSPVPHIDFARLLWENKDYSDALTELRIADAIAKKRSGLNIQNDASDGAAVLGVASSPLELLQVWKEAPQKAAERLKYWDQITKTYPDYRDGYLLAGIMAIQADEPAVAITYLNRAAILDPNNETLRQLLKMVSPTPATPAE